MSTTRSSSGSVTLSLPLTEERNEMHRSYQSILPCQNKLLQKRWDKTYYDEHRRKVANVVPMVDTRPPQTFMHLHLKLKKLQIEEDRLDIIERDNRILLDKMAYIMRNKGRVDNYCGYRNKSLNAERREREQLRISVENKNILRRIISRQPVYSHRAWLNDWNKNQELLSNISHFPNKWWKTSKSNSEKRTPRSDSTRRSRKAGGRSVRSRKDDDEYSQDYESEDAEEDTTAVNTTQRSEATTKEETPKTAEGKKKEEEKGEKGGVTEKKDEKKEEKKEEEKEKEKEHLEEKEITENKEIEPESEKMAKEAS